MRIDQAARARRAWPILVKVAKRRDKICYGDLCAKLGLHARAAGWFLGVIQNYCQSHRLPPLQCIAVNKRTRVPGIGYIATPRGGRAYDRARNKVYAKKWRAHPPTFDV